MKIRAFVFLETYKWMNANGEEPNITWELKESFWIVGIVEEGTNGRTLVMPVVNRNKETMNRITQHFIEPNSIVYTDLWLGYIDVQNHGLDHLTVNHSCNFINPETGANTQKIEGLWRHFRDHFPKNGVPLRSVMSYIYEFIYRYNFNKTKNTYKFLDAISEVYEFGAMVNNCKMNLEYDFLRIMENLRLRGIYYIIEENENFQVSDSEDEVIVFRRQSIDSEDIPIRILRN